MDRRGDISSLTVGSVRNKLLPLEAGLQNAYAELLPDHGCLLDSLTLNGCS
jgi:hypothetical protein